MAASDATPFPVKGKAYRLMFAMRKTDGTPLSSPWTSPVCSIILDATTTYSPTANQITGSHWGYIDLTTTHMNAQSICVSVSTSDADMVPYDAVIYPSDISLKSAGTAPNDVMTMFRQIHERLFGEVVNTGDFLKVMAEDRVTPIAAMPLVANPNTKSRSYT
jgi:hypothetical protein